MKRFVIATAIIVLIGAGAWTAVQRSRMKHPYTGQEITIPGTDGAGILLQVPDAFLREVKTTEARLTLASAVVALSGAALVGDAGGILSAVVSVDTALKSVKSAQKAAA